MAPLNLVSLSSIFPSKVKLFFFFFFFFSGFPPLLKTTPPAFGSSLQVSFVFLYSPANWLFSDFFCWVPLPSKFYYISYLLFPTFFLFVQPAFCGIICPTPFGHPPFFLFLGPGVPSSTHPNETCFNNVGSLCTPLVCSSGSFRDGIFFSPRFRCCSPRWHSSCGTLEGHTTPPFSDQHPFLVACLTGPFPLQPGFPALMLAGFAFLFFSSFFPVRFSTGTPKQTPRPDFFPLPHSGLFEVRPPLTPPIRFGTFSA